MDVYLSEGIYFSRQNMLNTRIEWNMRIAALLYE